MKTIRIKDIGKVVTGSTPSTRQPDYFGHDYPFIKPSDITPSIRRVLSTETMLSEAGRANQKTRLLPPDSSCVVCIGTIGKLCLTSRPSFINQQLNSVIPDPERFDPVYVYYLLSTMIPVLQQLQGGSASGREHINKSTFQEIEVNVHDLKCQRKIGAILSAYDDLIENNTRRIAILEEMAQAIYREWFVNFRFPGHEKIRLVDSPLGKIPDGWRATVGDFGRITTGKTPTKTRPENFGGEFPFIKTPDMHGNLFCTTTGETLSEQGVRSQPSQTVPPNAVCISCIGTVGAISITTETCQTNQQINTIVPHAPNMREYIVLCLRNSVPRLKQLGAAGSTMDNISKGKLNSFEILLPPSSLLEQFSCRTSDLFDRIKLLQKQSANLRTTRDLLLPKLISGQLEVEDIDVDLGVTAKKLEEVTA
jgi:type I restriction enzyme S subunit